MRVALVRHPAPLIASGTCYGRLDVPLSPAGVAGVSAIIQQLTGFAADVVWSSPAQRCAILADKLAASRDVSSCYDARLLELNFGDWEGSAWDSVPREALNRWAADPLTFSPPGGESGADLIARVKSFHSDLLARAHDCIVVSHGGPLKLLAALLRGGEMDLLTPAPALGSCEIIYVASADSAKHSTTISVAPSTSPV